MSNSKAASKSHSSSISKYFSLRWVLQHAKRQPHEVVNKYSLIFKHSEFMMLSKHSYSSFKSNVPYVFSCCSPLATLSLLMALAVTTEEWKAAYPPITNWVICRTKPETPPRDPMKSMEENTTL